MDQLKQLKDEVSFRDNQINLLYELLMRNNTFLYSILHLYGLSGTGKTFTIKRFMEKFCNQNRMPSNSQETNKFYVYLNCNEICYSNMSLLFNEILIQIKSVLQPNKKYDRNSHEFEIDIDDEKITFQDDAKAILNADIDEESGIKIVDCSCFIKNLKKIFEKINGKTCFFFIFDNAESLKLFNEASSNLILTLCKINEYINEYDYDQFECESNKVSICNLFITEIDWHSFLSDCDLMSKTEAPRPYVVAFSDYTKDQMCIILKKTACSLISAQHEFNNRVGSQTATTHQNINIEFYAKIILDVFYPICKDLNEIQYLIQIYFDQLMTSTTEASQDLNDQDSYDKMLIVWNKMKPFLKQALTQIYLRQSMFNSSSLTSKNQPGNGDEVLSKEFEGLNLANERNTLALASISSNINGGGTCGQFPKLMKFLLISAYIATHNPVKYDKKLFDYNSTNKYRKTKYTAQKLQQNEENQRAAALKTQTFDLNRLLAIFFPICAEYGYTQPINLSQIQINLKTLKSLHYLQQINSSYSCLDEPKYKCLLDFETIQNISSSVTFNIKQYLAEFLSI
jgi:Cdc6-like AAA superfamily ATPase